MARAQLIEVSGSKPRGELDRGGSALSGPLPRTIRVGCSGWQYTHWRGEFYPAELPTSRWFAHYALTFDTVEINNSFYRLPPVETFAKWREQAPSHFLYAVKASRFLTHMKKLKDPEDPLARFLDHARQLGPQLGPILYQLPSRWPINLAAGVCARYRSSHAFGTTWSTPTQAGTRWRRPAITAKDRCTIARRANARALHYTSDR